MSAPLTASGDDRVAYDCDPNGVSDVLFEYGEVLRRTYRDSISSIVYTGERRMRVFVYWDGDPDIFNSMNDCGVKLTSVPRPVSDVAMRLEVVPYE